MISRLRGLVGRVFGPLAALLLRWGVTPDAVTVVGTLGVVAAALTLFPTGHLFLGTMVIMVFAFSDALDGTMARASGRSGPWGAFLDSTLDRVADAGLFVGLAAYFLIQHDGVLATVGAVAAVTCLISGFTVSYSRARAEGLGMTANVGIAERGERLVVSLVFTGLVGLGVPPIALVIALILLAAASIITVGQRMATVYAQAQGRTRDSAT